MAIIGSAIAGGGFLVGNNITKLASIKAMPIAAPMAIGILTRRFHALAASFISVGSKAATPSNLYISG